MTEQAAVQGVQHPIQLQAKTDGRNTRRDRNRVAVVDAYLDLINDGNPRPSLAAVAELSGVSHRSVFRYFADRDELARTSIERQVSRVVSLMDTSIPVEATTSDRIELMLRRRLDLFEAITPVARLVRAMASEQPVVQAELANNRLLYRAQLQLMFAPELDAMNSTRASRTLAVIDVLCSFDGVDLMREDQGLSREETVQTLHQALMRLLSCD